MAPPPAAASSTGNTGAPPLSALTNQHSSAALDHTYELMSGSAPNQPSETRRRKRGLEEEEEEDGEEEQQQHHVTSSQDEGGTVGGASAVVLDGGRVRKQTQRARDLQEQLQAKVRSNSVLFLHSTLNPAPNPAPSLGLTRVLFCRLKRRRRGAPPLLCLVLP